MALAGAEMLLGGALDPVPLRAAVAAVRVPGRLELVPGAPALILDGAHNPAGMEAMARALPRVIAGRRPAVAVVSVLGDKDAAAMVAALAPVVDLVLATRSSHARAVDAGALAAPGPRPPARARGRSTSPRRPWRRPRAQAGSEGVVVVAGSLYLLADLRPRIVAGLPDPPATLARAQGGIAPTEAN